MRHTGGRSWVWRETCSLGDCPLVTAAHNSCLCSLSLSLCVVTVTVCSWLLSVLCSPSNSGTGSALTDIINTPRLRLCPESILWPGSGPHTSDGLSRTLTTGEQGVDWCDTTAPSTQDNGNSGKNWELTSTQTTLNKLYHNSSCHKRPILDRKFSPTKL